jgi:phosphomannomutase
MGGIVRAYDLRGVYGEEVDEGIAYRLGRALALWSGAASALVGRDGRRGSISLRDALVQGLTDQGLDVLDIGLCSTPMFYWATQASELGVMVTASHNPPEYNGFKICRRGAVAVGENNGLREIWGLLEKGSFPTGRRGSARSGDVLDGYLAFSLGFLKAERSFKVVVDAGNGMGGHVHRALAERLPSNIAVVPLFFDLDPAFPNHEPNPSRPSVLSALRGRVVEEGADFGVALDGDADRIAFVDERGEYVPSDITTALIARDVLREKPGSKILYDVRSSWATPEEIRAAGGVPVVTRVGHAFIKTAMREEKAAFGGELSGHFYHAEQQNSENTEIVLFRMLNLLAFEKSSLFGLAGPLRSRYPKIDETDYRVPDPAALVKRLGDEYGGMEGVRTVSHLDGVRVDFADWWFNVRPSRTEPYLRLNMAATTPELLRAKLAELEKTIRSWGGVPR